MHLGLSRILPVVTLASASACSSCDASRGRKQPTLPPIAAAAAGALIAPVASQPRYNPLWWQDNTACKSTDRDSLVISGTAALAKMSKTKPEWTDVWQMDTQTFGDNLSSTNPCVRASGIWGFYKSGHFDYGNVDLAQDLALTDPDPRVRSLAEYIVQTIQSPLAN